MNIWMVIHFAFFAGLGLSGPGALAGDDAPRIFLSRPEYLKTVRDRIQSGNHEYDPALKALRKNADREINEGPFTVMHKEVIPPSGDKHDYLSQGLYWWPDPSKPDGKPYIRRDGQINPEVKKITDEREMLKMSRAVKTLALQYYLSGEERYAARAALLLRTWYLDPQTRMNPQLPYSQFIPGRNQGRCYGIVDMEHQIGIPDAIGLLANSKSWSRADQRGMEEWFGNYLDWLTTSDNGKKESNTPNNHGTCYDAQVVSCALFCGRTNLAKSILEAVRTKRIGTHIEPDGRQPIEMKRTKAWTYSIKNLNNLVWLASMGEPLGVDLWRYESRDGRSIVKALEHLVPFATGEKPWPYQEINRKSDRLPGLSSLLRQAAISLKKPEYEVTVKKIGEISADNQLNLIWPILEEKTGK